MTISQALKEKNKIVTKIGRLYSKLQQNNSVVVGTARIYNPIEVYSEILVEEQKLIDIKTSIHRASDPVRSDIFTQSELKNRIKQIRNLNTSNGIIHDRYRHGDSSVQMEATYGAAWVDQNVESLEQKIEAIQEKLDKFNHTTNI